MFGVTVTAKLSCYASCDVIPAQAEIQNGTNWTPALPYPGSSGTWRHACTAGVTLGKMSE
jgi:hypothetical protein